MKWIKNMFKETAADEYDTDRLIILSGKGDYVAVSHRELDSLIGELMHLCELDSDVEHRTALKSEVKTRLRTWLDNQYMRAGYEKYLEDNRLGQSKPYKD